MTLDNFSSIIFEFQSSLTDISYSVTELQRSSIVSGDDGLGRCCDVTEKLCRALVEVSEKLLRSTAVKPEVKPDAKPEEKKPIDDFRIQHKVGVRRTSFEKYAPSIQTFATSTKPLPRICRENGVPYSSCRSFMMHYYPEAASRHVDVLEGKYVISGGPEHGRASEDRKILTQNKIFTQWKRKKQDKPTSPLKSSR